jgi:hypothetical protein
MCCYGHDAMGYCAAVFAAEKQITTNSIIRRNLCIDNGRSPKLARRQGDMFISTWEDGVLDGVAIENNTFYWIPLIDTPAVMMDHADFRGSRPNIVTGNKIFTAVSEPIHTSNALKFQSSTVAPIMDRLPPVADRPSRFRLVLTGADRAQVVFLQTTLVQYPHRLQALLVVPEHSIDFSHDWNLGRVRLSVGIGNPGL